KHRLQFVQAVEDRLFYNDSKATNMLATEKALQAFEQPTILLAGGLDRGDDFHELIPFLSHVKSMVVFGETKEHLQSLANELHIHVETAMNVEEAVNTAYYISTANDVILLSPACASWINIALLKKEAICLFKRSKLCKVLWEISHEL